MAKEKDRLEQLFDKRDEWRGKMKTAISVVKGNNLPWETNKHGKMRWYLHPEIWNTSIHSLMVYVQEIPPGSHTGKQKMQGGVVHFIIQGKGYTILDDVRHDWEGGDCVVLPVKPEGVTYQHFNADLEKPVRFIAAMPNLFDALGVDMGTGFEELEIAPEYKP